MESGASGSGTVNLRIGTVPRWQVTIGSATRCRESSATSEIA